MENNTRKLEMKILALKEGFKNKVANMLDEYEDRIADLRIELTELDTNNKQLQSENENLQALIQQLQEQLNPVDEPLEGDGNVQEEEPANEAD